MAWWTAFRCLGISGLASNICALGKPTVLVLVSGGVVAIDELKTQCLAARWQIIQSKALRRHI